jgi:hypothetical protein
MVRLVSVVNLVSQWLDSFGCPVYPNRVWRKWSMEDVKNHVVAITTASSQEPRRRPRHYDGWL